MSVWVEMALNIPVLNLEIFSVETEARWVDVPESEVGVFGLEDVERILRI